MKDRHAMTLMLAVVSGAVFTTAYAITSSVAWGYLSGVCGLIALYQVGFLSGRHSA